MVYNIFCNMLYDTWHAIYHIILPPHRPSVPRTLITWKCRANLNVVSDASGKQNCRSLIRAFPVASVMPCCFNAVANTPRSVHRIMCMKSVLANAGALMSSMARSADAIKCFHSTMFLGGLCKMPRTTLPTASIFSILARARACCAGVVKTRYVSRFDLFTRLKVRRWCPPLPPLAATFALHLATLLPQPSIQLSRSALLRRYATCWRTPRIHSARSLMVATLASGEPRFLMLCPIQ